MKRTLILAALAFVLPITAYAQAPAAQPPPPAATQFKVRIENVSNPNSIKAPGGKRQGVGLSPGVWCVHTPGEPFFTEGQNDRGQGLMMQSEDGDPGPLAKSLIADLGSAMQMTDANTKPTMVLSSGVFMIPVGKAMPGPLKIGNAYEFTVSGTPGTCLSLTVMHGNSNDWFFAFAPGGLPLFDSQGKPVRGDVTKSVTLWDAGTEVNEEPGIGPNQGDEQSAPGVGVKEHVGVMPAGHEFVGPPVSQIIKVSIKPM